MSTVTKDILRELGQLNRKSVFDEKAILEPHEDNAQLLNVTLTPKDGMFAGASVPFEFEFSEDYPATAPTVRSVKNVYHSNISDGSVCLNMLSEPQEGYRIEHYVNGLLWLLDNQNFNSQLNGYVTSDKPQFKVNHLLALRGYEICNNAWDKLLDQDPSEKDQRKLLNDILALSGVAKEVEVNFEAFDAAMPEKGHLEFLKDQVQVFKKVGNQGLQTVKFVISKSNCTHVAVRAKNAKVSPSSVVKEMILMVDEQPVLLLTNGPESIDLEKLSAALDNRKVVLPKAGDLKRSGVANVYEVNLFDWTGPIYADATLATLPDLVASSGFPRLLVKAPGATLLSLAVDPSKTITISVPRIPLPESGSPASAPTSTEPAISAPASVPIPTSDSAVVPAPIPSTETQEPEVLIAKEVAPQPEEPVPSQAPENEKEIGKREGSLTTDAKKERKLTADVPAICRVPSDDGAVKVSLQSN